MVTATDFLDPRNGLTRTQAQGVAERINSRKAAQPPAHKNAADETLIIEPKKNLGEVLPAIPDIAPSQMTLEALDALLTSHAFVFERTAKLMPFVKEMHTQFQAKGKSWLREHGLFGCYSWSEYCEKRLKRKPEYIRQLLKASTTTQQSETEAKAQPEASPADAQRVHIPHDGDPEMPLYTSTGLLVATGYSRVVFGDRGPYVEFTRVEEANLRLVPDSGHIYFDEYRTVDAANVMVYLQRRTVKYADYRVGHWYVSPGELFTSDGIAAAEQSEPDAPVAAHDVAPDGETQEDDKNTKNSVVTINVTPSQLTWFERVAKKQGMKLQDWTIHTLCQEAYEYEKINPELAESEPETTPTPPIPYDPNFLSKDEADALFEVCKKQGSTREPSDRNPKHLKRRLTIPSWSALPTFRGKPTGKTLARKQSLENAPPEIKSLAEKLTKLAGKPINYLSLVGYENEKDHIVWHQHPEDDCRDARVFIVSLGETRTFGVREVCPEGRLCPKCDDAACNGGVNRCDLCQAARQHRKTCPKCKDRKNWTLIQPLHGSLITLPHEYNKTHEHAVLEDKGPKGLRISINTKNITQEDIDYFRTSMPEPQSPTEPQS